MVVPSLAVVNSDEQVKVLTGNMHYRTRVSLKFRFTWECTPQLSAALTIWKVEICFLNGDTPYTNINKSVNGYNSSQFVGF